MVDGFLAKLGRTPVDVTTKPDQTHGFRLVDPELAREWRDFYRSEAEVEVVVT